MSNNSKNITLRDYKNKSKNDETTEKIEPRKTIKTATFTDIWPIVKFEDNIPKITNRNNAISSPNFTHDFNGGRISCTARIYTIDAYGGLVVVESTVKGAEKSTTKVQCFLRNVKKEDIRLSTCKRENNRFKHVTQPAIILNEDNGLIPEGVLTVVLKIQVTINQDYNTVKDARLADDLASLLQNGNFSDVTFLVDGHSIKAHKGILSCRSSTFASLFHNEPCEVVEIQHFDVAVVKEMLNFCYTGWVDEISVELLVASEEFDIVGLKIVCEDHLSQKLTVDNASALLVCAEKYRAPSLKKKAMQFVAKNLKECVNQSQFRSISNSTILDILQMWSAL